ncbi:uncharacterized protein LOC100202793 [Hydra vulgaris]|uniref:Uncharacterized protein LOC100202793 n=1 Tax=Hydra vulgaris TaxID=6087 RepID=A0ABM4CW78_HYDVU
MTFSQRFVIILFIISLPQEVSLLRKGCGKTALHFQKSLQKRSKYHVITDLDEVFKGIRRSVDDDCENQGKDERFILESSVGAVSSNKRMPESILNEINEKSKNALSSFTSKRAGILPTSDILSNEIKSNNTDTKRLLTRRLISVSAFLKDNKHVPENDSLFNKISLTESNKETIITGGDNNKVVAPHRSSSDVVSPSLTGNEMHLDHMINNVETADVNNNKKQMDSLNPVFNDNDPNDKRTSTRKPNLKTLKNSPLWSLSKLIDDVSLLTANKKTDRLVSTADSSKAVEEKNKLKINFAEASEPNLHKTAEKKSVSKDKKVDNLIDRVLSSTKYSSSKDNVKVVTDNVKTANTKTANITSSEKVKNVTGEKTNITTVTTQQPKEAPDPYAEIAAGPDRPKIPVLKTDDPSSDLAPMKMETMKNFKPLSGQHDVGGLLDSLTDKLNAGGGDVAPEQPLTLPQDMSNPYGDDASLTKDPQESPLIDKPVNPDIAPLKEDSLTQDPLPKLFSDKESALDQPQPISESRMEQAAAAVGLDKEVMEKLASTDESFSKALTDKDGAINKFGSMDLLKDPSKNDAQDMNDFGGADISPGPDPYSNPGGSDQGIPNDGDSTIGTEYGRRPSMNDIDNSELVNGGGAGVTSIPEQGMKEGFGQEVGYDQMGLHGYEQNEELTGNTRTHTNRDDSYLNAALGAMGVAEGGAYVRHAIPRWDMPYEDNRENSFSNSYNTHMFKKNIILRPKRDKYVSPFYDRESFDNDW